MNPKFESPNTINSQFCFYYEMIFFLSGDVNYTIEDRHYKLRPGDLLLISKSDTHHADLSSCKPYERIEIYLTDIFFQYMQTFFQEDFTSCFTDDITPSPKINQLIAFINDNLTEDLSLDFLANEFYISKYYLSRKFKEFTGLSLYQYIMKKRLLLARDMLRNGASVMNACFLCGFNDYSNFFRAFKREFGYPPSSYSKE